MTPIPLSERRATVAFLASESIDIGFPRFFEYVGVRQRRSLDRPEAQSSYGHHLKERTYVDDAIPSLLQFPGVTRCLAAPRGRP